MRWIRVWIWRLRNLTELVCDAYGGWREEFRSADPDERYCCDGRECCCCGMTKGEAYPGWNSESATTTQ